MHRLLERLNRMPPAICRLLARTGPRNRQCPMTNRQIAARAGLDPSTITRLSKLASWDSVPLSTIVRFAQGCGVDPLAAKQDRRLFKRTDTKLKYWTNCTPAQRSMIQRIQKQFTGSGQNMRGNLSNR